LLCQDEILRALRWVAAVVRRPREQPTSRPIERIAGDAGRVRAKLLALAADTPMPRRIGVLQAYDDLLAEACRALAVPDSLTCLPLGLERDAELLRVEYELAAAGLPIGGGPRE
jgi:hypothetical protein